MRVLERLLIPKINPLLLFINLTLQVRVKSRICLRESSKN